jgi:hypothetical protein
MNGHIIKTEEDVKREERMNVIVDHVFDVLDGVPLGEAGHILDIVKNDIGNAQRDVLQSTAYTRPPTIKSTSEG